MDVGSARGVDVDAAAGGERLGSDERHDTMRLLPLVVPVALAGLAVLVAACFGLAADRPALASVAGALLMLAGALFLEAFPVPVDGLPAGYVSLAAVFIVGAAVAYGSAEAILVAFLTGLALELVRRNGPLRVAYNSAVYTLAGAAAAGGVALAPDGGRVVPLLLQVLVGATAFYFTNVGLATAVIARWAREPFLPFWRRSTRATLVPFSIMASISLMLAVLWERSPVLAGALVGPLVATILYQRSVHSALRAMRLALTDSVTGLGNKRHFEERLQRELGRAEVEQTPVTLCVIDVDDFKRINDTYGHVEGDCTLARVAANLRRGGEAFRIGGDEFALLLAGCGEDEGSLAAHSVLRRISGVALPGGETLAVSIGVATYPCERAAPHDLVRLADDAVYAAKRDGKNRVHAHRAGSSSRGSPGMLVLEGRGGTVGALLGRVAERLGVETDDFAGEQLDPETAAAFAAELGEHAQPHRASA